MTKCVRLYRYGDGRIELAESKTNNWFIRSYELNNYGYAWTKWESLGKLVSLKRKSTTWENLNGNVITTKSIDLTFSNGSWSVKLREKIDANNLKYRLPF